MIIANLLPCKESNTVVVDPAKLHGCETTGNIYWNSDMGVIDHASTQCCETTVQSTLPNGMAVRLLSDIRVRVTSVQSTLRKLHGRETTTVVR